MHSYSLDFCAFPDVSPIPKGMIAHIGGITAEKPIFALRKDNSEIYIHVDGKISDHPREAIDPDDPFYCYKKLREHRKVYAYYLEVIQQEGLQSKIDFGGKKIVYLSKTRTGGHFISHSRDLPVYSLSCPTWARRIREDEIEFTVWGGISDRRGVWRAKNLQVDIVYAWSETEFKFLDATMHGYKGVEGLDITFEVYGHLIGANDNVIGLVTEAAWGRMVKPSDRSLVMAAIAKLQKHGFIYEGCLRNRFVVSRTNKVRLLDPSCIKRYPTQKTFDKAAQKFHWEDIKQLFDELNERGPFGNDRLLPARFTATTKDIIFLPPFPSPIPKCRIFDVLTIYEVFAHTFGNPYKIQFEDDNEPHCPQIHRDNHCLLGRRPIRGLIQLTGNSNSPRTLCPKDSVDKLYQTPSEPQDPLLANDRSISPSRHLYKRARTARQDGGSSHFILMPSN